MSLLVYACNFIKSPPADSTSRNRLFLDGYKVGFAVLACAGFEVHKLNRVDSFKMFIGFWVNF